MRQVFGQPEARDDEPNEDPQRALTDGALDTLSSVIRTMGTEAFPLDTDPDPAMFTAECAEFVRHIENGAAVPSFDIPQSEDGKREWPQLRAFFKDRRRAEKNYVIERIGNYREVVEELVASLRRIGERDKETESRVTQSLMQIERAVRSGEIQNIRSALRDTMESVTSTFEAQRQAYEEQLGELNERMTCLRQDLVAAREEMKRDPLTDAYNRGAFDSALDQSLNMHYVLQQPATLVLIDLDKFKEINDGRGHTVGDKVLQAIGECLARAFIRRNDFVARYGGDEFAVILSDTNHANAKRVIERFVESVSRLVIQADPEPVQLTCSVGYTELTAEDTAETAIARADVGLYAVKSRGGNGAEYAAATPSGH